MTDKHFHFAATNTREGCVLQKLSERLEQIEADSDPQRTRRIFNVLGGVFPLTGTRICIRGHQHLEPSGLTYGRISMASP